jgi:AhpC/TSA family
VATADSDHDGRFSETLPRTRPLRPFYSPSPPRSNDSLCLAAPRAAAISAVRCGRSRPRTCTAVNSRNHRAMLNHLTNIAITTSCLHGPKRRGKLQDDQSAQVAASPMDVEVLPMSLKEKLDATRAASAARVPADKRAIMTRATADLRASGILEKVLAVGQPAPEFSAPNHDGRMISSRDLIARGPLVISFFRGAW